MNATPLSSGELRHARDYGTLKAFRAITVRERQVMHSRLVKALVFLGAILALSAPARAWLDTGEELSDREWMELENARRAWQGVQRWDDGQRTRLYDKEIEDTLRHGRQGDIFWKSEFNRLLGERRRAQRNAMAIEAARWEWERERARERNAHTRRLDRTIDDTLNNAEWDESGAWRMDFDRLLRTRRTARDRLGTPPSPSLPPPPPRPQPLHPQPRTPRHWGRAPLNPL